MMRVPQRILIYLYFNTFGFLWDCALGVHLEQPIKYRAKDPIGGQRGLFPGRFGLLEPIILEGLKKALK